MKFLADPEAYLPEHGGYCSTAMAMNMKVNINATSFLVTKGRLFLFSDTMGPARDMFLKNQGKNTRDADYYFEKRIQYKGLSTDLSLNSEGQALGGYDLVSYFSESETPIMGSSEFESMHMGAKYQFSSQENLEKFKADPAKYLPEYGGHCATAMGMMNIKGDPDPMSFVIEKGNLYLFSSDSAHDKNKWLEDEQYLKEQADMNWNMMIQPEAPME